MKNNIVIAVLVMLTIFQVEAQKKTPVQLKGSVKGISSGKVYLRKFDNKMFFPVDSAKIINGQFKFTKAIVLPELYGLSLDTLKGTYYLFLENKPVTVQLDSADYYAQTTVKGSASQDLFVNYKKQENVDISEFIKQNPSSLVSAYVLYRDFSYQLSAEEIKANIKLLNPSLHKTPYVKVLNQLASVLETVSVGKKAPDFTAPDPDGVPQKLSDHFGNYLLIDFWASWCSPCREENPNFVRIYNKFKDKGFNIFAVSLDKNKERWMKGIKDDGLAWTQVSDLQFWNSAPAKLYGVRAIPSNVLVDPNGTIIARNIMGEELEKMLTELFK